MGVTSYFRRITNFSRQATKVASESVQGVATAVKKPTKREDYIETGRLFISKSFLILAAVGLILFGLFCYLVAWPFILSHFLTARFYQEDSRIPDWSGKVIVYYDREKKIPMYSGTLKDGLLQGPGMEYDEEGLLVYEGDFTGGVRSGNGLSYTAGVLAYEGQFADGVYEGMGTLYEDGARVYSGAFARGLANGVGTAYDGGTKCYEGSFADGLYEGEGSAYNGAGRMVYRGSFAAGLYDGSGTVYLENGDWIQSEFSAGVGCGIIRWYKHGRLWYDGGADDLTPDGFGTVYAASGKVVYAGEMDRGTLDGGWLLTRTAQELREVFGEASAKETGRTGAGFLMINSDLGLTILCTFREGTEEPHAHRIWFAPEEGSDAAALMPWEDRVSAEAWARTDRDTLESSSRTKGTAFLPAGGVGGDWYHSIFNYEDHGRALISRESGSAPFQIIWAQPGGMDVAAPGAADESVAQAQERLDSLLETLEGVGGADSGAGGGPGGGGPGGGGPGGGAEASSADPGDVERMLAMMSSPQDACSLVNALTDYYVYGQALGALEASRPLLEQALEEQQKMLQRGQGGQSAVESARDRLDSLDRQLLQYRVIQEQAKLIAQRLTGVELETCDVRAVLRVIDVADLDAGGLYGGALAYAEGMAAGRYDVDATQVELDVKTQVLDLVIAYENIRSGQQSLERAAGFLEETTQAYTKGTADKAALYDAQCGVNDTVAALFQSMGAYTKLINRLNDLSGGQLAKEHDWFAVPFSGIYEDAVRQAGAEAEEERRKQEEEEKKDQEQADPDKGEDPAEGDSGQAPEASAGDAPAAGDEERTPG